MMSRWCDQSIPDERHSAFSSGPLEVAVLFGTLVAETILASVHVRAHKQAGHMDASDLIKHCKTPCKEGVVHIWKISGLPWSCQFCTAQPGCGQHLPHFRSRRVNLRLITPIRR